MNPLDTAEGIVACPICGEAVRRVRDVRIADLCHRITAHARARHTLAALESIADSLRALVRQKEW